MDLETPKNSSNNSQSTESAILFKNKNKIFKKMQNIVAECNKTTSSINLCPSFSNVETFLGESSQISIEPQNSQNQKSEKKYSKDHRERKELYIQFLEKKIYELLDHIYFVQKTQEQVAKKFYANLFAFAEQLESERNKTATILDRKQKEDGVLGWDEEDSRTVSSFEDKQGFLKKKVVEGTFQTLINYGVPRLLHYMSSALSFERSDSLILSGGNPDFELLEIKQEILGQKENSDRILFDILHLRNKMDEQLSSFDVIYRKISGNKNMRSRRVYQKLLEIENMGSNFYECQFLDEKTKSILKYFQPVCV